MYVCVYVLVCMCGGVIRGEFYRKTGIVEDNKTDVDDTFKRCQYFLN